MAIFLTKASRFAFLARSLAPKQTTSSLDWSSRGLSREPFIPAVRVLCQPHSYKFPLPQRLLQDIFIRTVLATRLIFPLKTSFPIILFRFLETNVC